MDCIIPIPEIYNQLDWAGWFQYLKQTSSWTGLDNSYI